jgi:fructokinase
MILVGGEALIDFIPARSEDGAPAYLPRPGGSPYNVAVALGRLGVPTAFAGGISTDFFGDQLVENLRASGVRTDCAMRLDRPSTLAFASLGRPEPAYAFYDAGAADRHWQLTEEMPGPEIRAVHAGSLALAREPAAGAYEALIQRAHLRGLAVSLDPNIRAERIADNPAHRSRLERLAAAADIVKLSLADLAWMAPGAPADEYAAALLRRGPSLVVITAGAAGASAYGRAARAHRPAVPVQVIDTVGAGDSFMAGLLAGLWDGGWLHRAALAELAEPALAGALELGSQVAAITSSRIGADPPWRRELRAVGPPASTSPASPS